METVVEGRLSDKLTKEIAKMLPEIRKNLQIELYKSVGYFPKKDFYSNNKVLDSFYTEAGRYLSLVGRNENEIENFCTGDIRFSSENREIISKIATLTLVQLAM